MLVAFVCLAGISLWIYRAALTGPFISDDHLYVANNPFVTAPGWTSLRTLLDPTGPGRLYSVGNYAPAHMAAHMLEWVAFGSATTGYHVANLLLHALNATLLAALLAGAGVPAPVALTASAVFALHPANVEAVAWISQLKSVLALTFSFAALMLFRGRPRASAIPFALALLTKATAVFALPMAAALVWAWRRSGAETSRHVQGLALWILALALYALPQFLTYDMVGRAYALPYPDAWSHLLSIAAIGARYLAMAATGFGTSAYHEPDAVRGVLDPWALAGLAAAPIFVWRIATSLRAGREEAAWWIGAAAAFAPVSQVFPFYFAMADRYLYFILPGLIGGALLWWVELRARLPRAVESALLAGGCALAVVFGLRAEGRSQLWQDEIALVRDGASQYPNGGGAHYLQAAVHAQAGENQAAVAELRRAVERGYHYMRPFQADPWLQPLHGDPGFEALMQEVYANLIEYARERGFSSQEQLQGVARAHWLRGEMDEAIAVIEEAIRSGDEMDSVLINDLNYFRTQRAERLRATEAGKGR
jgi:tetratricopeptide (TPR) repeat protein